MGEYRANDHPYQAPQFTTDCTDPRITWSDQIGPELLKISLVLVYFGLFIWKCLIPRGCSKNFLGQGPVVLWSWAVLVQCGLKFQISIQFLAGVPWMGPFDVHPTRGTFCIDFVNKILRFWDGLILVCQYVQSVLKVILGKSSFPTSGVIKFLLTPIGEIRLTSNSYDY